MSLHGAYDTDNIFAKILRGDMPSLKLYEDENVLAFMDVFPQSPGHCLVVPKSESRNILDTPPKTLASLIVATQKIAKAVEKALSPDGIIISQFNGAPAGQTVFHLHFHVIPRYDGKDTKPHASGGKADMDSLRMTAEKISAALSH